MLDIKLSVAKVIETDNLIHVSERLPVGATLCCPFCNYPVSKKAGSVRRHHFSHKAGSDCNVSAETLLHEGAKVYIFNKLETKQPFEISINVAFLKDSLAKELLLKLNLSSISIKSTDILSEPYHFNEIEKAIQSIRPDVVSYKNSIKDAPFAWEVYVTHEIEPDKKEYFASQSIPFIELIPSEFGQNDYSFVLHDYHGTELLNYDSKLMHCIYELNKRLIFNEFKELIESEYIIDQIDFNTRSHKANLTKLQVDNISKINKVDINKYKDSVSLDIAQSFNKVFITSLKMEGVWEKVTELNYVKGLYGYSVVINGNYIDSPIRMLSRIYEDLYESDMCRAVINEGSQCIGIKLNTPYIRENKYKETLIVLSNEKVLKDDVIIHDTEGNRSKANKPYMLISDGYTEYFVKFHDTQLNNILKYFNEHYGLRVLIGKNEEGKKRVVGIKVIGLPDEIDLKYKLQKIVDVCTHDVAKQLVSHAKAD